MDTFRGTGSGMFLESLQPLHYDPSRVPRESLTPCQPRTVSSLSLVWPILPSAGHVPHCMLPRHSWLSQSCSRDVRTRTPEPYASLRASHIDSLRWSCSQSQSL